MSTKPALQRKMKGVIHMENSHKYKKLGKNKTQKKNCQTYNS
jgi:hypothetical protein